MKNPQGGSSKNQTIEDQRDRLFTLSNSLVQTQEEKTALEKKFGQERNKETEGIDQLIEVLKKRIKELERAQKDKCSTIFARFPSYSSLNDRN